MKQTKENLIEELGKLKRDVETRNAKDELMRKEFAKIFNWFKTQGMYDREKELFIPSWFEIFTEIGKLLSQRDFRNLEGNVSELECKLEDLETKIKKEIHPNL